MYQAQKRKRVDATCRIPLSLPSPQRAYITCTLFAVRYGTLSEQATMEPPPLAKRTLRPTASLPTTAETYGEKHGIDPEVQRALQNVGWRSRQSESRAPGAEPRKW